MLRQFHKRILITISVAIIFIILHFIIMFTVYNPAVVMPLYGWFQKHEWLNNWIETENPNYQLVSIRRLTSGLFFKPHAKVIGIVTAEVRAPDGDWHLNIEDEKNNVLVAEIIPEHPLTLPPMGANIEIWGITRYDLDWHWWEIHPVIGWKKL